MDGPDTGQPPPMVVTPNKNTKKLNRNYVGADSLDNPNTTKSHNETFDGAAHTENVWNATNLKEVLNRRPAAMEYYTGEGETDLLDSYQDSAEPGKDIEENIPEYIIPDEEIRVMATPYRRALVIKILGRCYFANPLDRQKS
ncbi:hypothetical protein BUALT_Bualt13G0058200 [Buddleja alternifolia]|uniref:Uncharacterized protein n=1 Tax=Buddleja alternifolia TaxID=168488 RepID=A0AAV6WTK7_9LAMI|nr:hypothetical protein BUALT_Bualt13G0058200 [Buddleja alternifolia]